MCVRVCAPMHIHTHAYNPFYLASCLLLVGTFFYRKYQTSVLISHIFCFLYLVLCNILINPVLNNNTSSDAAFPWLCPLFCGLYSRVVDIPPLCGLPILSSRGPGSILGFKRKSHRKCKASSISFFIWPWTTLWLAICSSDR